jgi:hypothetical protein
MKNHIKEKSISDILNAINDRAYGKFTLINAVALFKDSEIISKLCYQTESYISRDGVLFEPIIISVSAEMVICLFDEFLTPLGDTCRIQLEDLRDIDADRAEHLVHCSYHKDTVVVCSLRIVFE